MDSPLVPAKIRRITAQIFAIGAVVGYCVIGTAVFAFLIDKFIGLRVSAEEEAAGLDSSLHDEELLVSPDPIP